MAATAALRTGVDRQVWDVTATADGDNTVDLTHGMSSAPEEVILMPVKSEATIANWYIAAIDATKVTVTKRVTTASGVAGVSLTVILRRSTHIGR